MPTGYGYTFSQTLPDGSDRDDVIIDCYRLAHHYKQNPDVFLIMPLSDVMLHLQRTTQLMDIMARERKEREDG